jgi:hypothetical protein
MKITSPPTAFLGDSPSFAQRSPGNRRHHVPLLPPSSRPLLPLTRWPRDPTVWRLRRSWSGKDPGHGPPSLRQARIQQSCGCLPLPSPCPSSRSRRSWRLLSRSRTVEVAAVGTLLRLALIPTAPLLRPWSIPTAAGETTPGDAQPLARDCWKPSSFACALRLNPVRKTGVCRCGSTSFVGDRLRARHFSLFRSFHSFNLYLYFFYFDK